jgi:hypothetical protein
VTARVSISISSMVTGSVDPWPSTVIAAESPTRMISTPAASARRALDASYAVTMAIRWCVRPISCTSVSVSLRVSVMMPGLPEVRLNRQHP